ncbi:MAG: rRNA pseudouridine synthase [Gammaproteobacteria bacterium]|nr:rRNA pseudouridine synthase [Gammaproteobacteria bacterium]
MTTRPSRALARILSKHGVASRTTAALWIQAGRVAVNETVIIDPGFIVVDNARITLDGRELIASSKLYFALNKPRGLITTTHDEHSRATVYECLPPELRSQIAPVGRLDKASEGLLLFSNDTAWSARLLDPARHLPKRYHVQINRLPDSELFQTLQRGVSDAGERLELAAVSELRRGDKNAWLEITLTSGKNRHIRRMLSACNTGVLRLIRISIGPLQLGTLPKGQCRALEHAELQQLALALST